MGILTGICILLAFALKDAGTAGLIFFIGLVLAIGSFGYVMWNERTFAELERWNRPAAFGSEPPAEAEGGNAAVRSAGPAGSFVEHFHELKCDLEHRAESSHAQAALALDQAVSWAWRGIVVYAMAIVFWQALTWFRGFHAQFIYGMVSCSLLFIFIEFFAGWFLKQYRAFIDTSMYLMKVRAMFDRYMLLYLTQGDERIGSAASPGAHTLFAMLEAEIRWPDSYIGRDPDTNLAREMVAALTELIGTARQRRAVPRGANGQSSPAPTHKPRNAK
jgi:hypothetical protein